MRWSAGSGILLGVGFVVERLGAPDVAVTLIYAASVFAGARFFALEAVDELWNGREVGIELLMSVAALAAGILGLWGEAATLAFLYSISEALEEFTEERTRNAIRALMDLAPRSVTVIESDGSERDIDLKDLKVNDCFLVRPGQGIATDGTIVEGRSAVDESAITGESIPVEKAPNDRAFAGTFNAQGALVVQATATYEDNTLAKIVHLVSDAQQQKGRGQRFMERFAGVYSPAVLGTGILIALAGGVLTGEWSVWTERAATVMVAAAPCALVISIPVTYVAAIGNASRKGILIKGGAYLEELSRVRIVAIDKTGTLTQGTPVLTEVVAADGSDHETVLRFAAAVERRSEHPFAKAILRGAIERRVSPPAVKDFEALTGAGARGRVNGEDIVVASPQFFSTRAGDSTDLAGRSTSCNGAARPRSWWRVADA